MTPRNKHEAFAEAEKILDQYAGYVADRVLTFNEAVEILCDSKKVVTFFDKAEIEAILSFAQHHLPTLVELQKGQTVQ